MQVQWFNGGKGGFVIHRAVPGKRVSAWYSSSGELLDCVQVDSRNRCRGISRPDRESLVCLGRVYAKVSPPSTHKGN